MDGWQERDEVRFQNLSRVGTEPGKRYRYFNDPRLTPDRPLVVGSGLFTLAIIFLSAFATVPIERWLEFVGGMATVGLVCIPVAYWGYRDWTRRQQANKDMVVRLADGLVVIRGDGTQLTFGPDAVRKHELVAHHRPGSESWREGKRKYTIPLRDLVEIEEPDEAVKVELKQLLTN